MVRIISTADLDFDFGGDSDADGFSFASDRVDQPKKGGSKGRIVRGKTIGKIVKPTEPLPPPVKLEVGKDISTTNFPWEK